MVLGKSEAACIVANGGYVHFFYIIDVYY